MVEIACHFAGKQSYARVFLQIFEQIPSDVSENNLEELVSVIKIIKTSKKISYGRKFKIIHRKMWIFAFILPI